MKFKLTLLAISSSLLVAAPPLLSQNINLINLPVTNTWKYELVLDYDRSLGERALLPPGLKEKLKLTDAQRADLKPIEDDFAITSEKYQIGNQSRIDDAQEAIRRARTWKDPAQTRAARQRLQDIWVGLHRDRENAVIKIKPLLTADQVIVLQDARNQWRENHADEVNDPSAHGILVRTPLL